MSSTQTVPVAAAAASASASATSGSSSASATRQVVVIGSGLAGLSATIEAAHNGAHVTLIEKESRLGGNSAKATSGMNSAIATPEEAFLADSLASAGGEAVTSLVEKLVSDSAEALEWLKSPPFSLDLTKVSQCGGHSHPRTHRIPSTGGKPAPVGFLIIRALRTYVEQQLSDQVTIRTQTRVVRLITNQDDEKMQDGDEKKQQQEQTAPAASIRVIGVVTEPADSASSLNDGTGDVAEQSTIPADAVVLASGGFSANRELLEEATGRLGRLASMPTTNGVWAQGEGLKLGQSIGAAVHGLKHVQLHPTGFIQTTPEKFHSPTKFLAPEALRGSGGILVNMEGHRFVNELSTRDVVSDIIIRRGCKMGVEPTEQEIDPNRTPHKGLHAAALLLDDDMIEVFGRAAVDGFYAKIGAMHRVQGLAGVAKLIAELREKFDFHVHVGESIDAQRIEENLEETIAKYNAAAAGKIVDETGKTVFPRQFVTQTSEEEDKPIYLALVTPVIHYTMGGLTIDTEARILNAESDSPISGLFGAGEVTGGVHGKNRLAGSSLLECVVYGRTAGRNAALGVKTHSHSHDEL